MTTYFEIAPPAPDALSEPPPHKFLKIFNVMETGL